MMQRRSDHDDRALLAEAEVWPEMAVLDDIDPRGLAELVRRRGVDFATAVLYDRLRKSARHGPLLRQDANAAAMPEPSAVATRAAWLVVPGAFHRERPNTGADGAELKAQAERLGVRCDVV